MAKRKPYTNPNARVTDKDKIIEYAEDFLLGSNNEFIVMNDFVHNDMQCPEPHGNTNFIGDIAYKMRNTGKYELKESNNRYVVYKKEKKSWKERYWLLIAAGGFVIGFFADIAKEIYLQNSTKEKQKSEQVIPIQTDNIKAKVELINHSVDSLTLVKKISLNDLVKEYRALDGQGIQTEGIVYFEFENVAICADKGYDGKCFWLDMNRDLLINDSLLQKASGQNVVLKGTVDISSKGHLNGYLATIRNVYYLKTK
jgi:hypothetical protein